MDEDTLSKLAKINIEKPPPGRIKARTTKKTTISLIIF